MVYTRNRNKLSDAQKAELQAKHDNIIAYLEASGYSLDDVFYYCEEEAMEYAEEHGYHYCDSCDERIGDPSDRY